VSGSLSAGINAGLNIVNGKKFDAMICPSVSAKIAAGYNTVKRGTNLLFVMNAGYVPKVGEENFTFSAPGMFL
jgi:hypothetical protein